MSNWLKDVLLYIALSLVLLAATWGLLSWRQLDGLPQMAGMLVFLLVLTIIVHNLHRLGSRLPGRQAVSPLMLAIVLKLLFSSLFLFVMLYLYPGMRVLIVVVFLVYYAVFAAAAVVMADRRQNRG